MLRKDFGGYELTEIDRELVTEWMNARLADKAADVKSSTVNREVDVLKAVLLSAVPKYLEASPLYGMKRLRPQSDEEVFEPRILTRDEEERLLRQLAVDDRALLLCALDSVTRLRDALDLRRDRSGNVQDRGTHILLLNPKNGKRQTKPVTKRLREALDRVARGDGPYYFHRRRVAKTERDRRGAVRDMLEAACKRCDPPIPYGRNVGGITFHTATRHTGASRMVNDGKVHPRDAQTIAGWSRMDQITRYAHPNAENLVAAVESIAAQPAAPSTDKDSQIADLERRLAELRKRHEKEAAARRLHFSVVRASNA
jgi:integrase